MTGHFFHENFRDRPVEEKFDSVLAELGFAGIFFALEFIRTICDASRAGRVKGFVGG
jgi:hypothetical protein